MKPDSGAADIGYEGVKYTLPAGYSFVGEKDAGFEDFKGYGDTLVLAVRKDSDPGVAMAITLCKGYTEGQSKFVSDFSDAMMASYAAEGIDAIADSGTVTIAGEKYSSYDIYINGDNKIIYRSACVGNEELYHILAVGDDLNDLKDLFAGFN